MKIEHFALNVADPVKMADWYCENLGMRVVRKIDGKANTHFLADSAGTVMTEIYNNPVDSVPNYRAQDPLILHLAFVSENPVDDSARLIRAGASKADEVKLPDGSHLVMLRDPWGLAIQLCKRGKPMTL
jgi:glyoxylase I family protein